jgi:nucleoside-diphosphate-sugar epimerase
MLIIKINQKSLLFMSSVRKRVFVTGSAGFLGSHLRERLIGGSDDVLCVDNYFTGRKKNDAVLCAALRTGQRAEVPSG